MPVYYKGKVVGHTTRKSDTLLMFAIKNLQRRREQEVRKTSSLYRFFGGSGVVRSVACETSRRMRKTQELPRRR